MISPLGARASAARLAPFLILGGIFLVLGGAFAPPAAAVVSPISTLHQNDANGVVLNKGSNITITGVVTSPDSIFTKTSTDVYIQDATGGVEIFHSGGIGLWHFSLGDSVTVDGRIGQFNGMTELDLVNSVTLNATGKPQPVPVVKTCDQVVTQTYNSGNNTEPDEGRVIRVNNLHLTSGTWPTSPSGSNVSLNAIDPVSANQLKIFIDKDSPLNGSPAPGDTFDLVGVLHQFDTTIIYNFGYELDPRFLWDVIRRGPAFLTGPSITALDSTSATIAWTTDKRATGRIDYGTTTGYGQVVSHGDLSTSHVLALTGLTPNTLYHYKATSVDSLGATSATGDLSFITPSNRPGIINVYFNHSVDAAYATGPAANGNANLATLLINRINSATYSLDCAFYSFSYSQVTDALIAAWNRGVKVRFIMEATNSQSEMNRLSAAGIPCITSTYGGSHSGIMHNKFCVVDGRDGSSTNDWTWTGSTNVTSTGLFNDAQNAIELQDYSLAQAYTLEFNEMWGSDTDTPNAANSKMGNRKSDNTPHQFTINGLSVEMYMSPSDATESHIVSTINALTKSAFFCILSFTQDTIENALWGRWNGVPGFLVKGVFDSGIDPSSEWYDLKGISGGNHPWSPPADVFTDGLSSGLLHHKYLVGDEDNPPTSVTVTGSHNWSNSANSSNDENTLIIHDPAIANLYLQEFVARYHEAGGSQSIPLPPTAVGDGGAASGALALGLPRPNPAPHGLEVAYSAPAGTRVVLSVYDVSGRLLRTLAAGDAGAAQGRAARWDGRDASGTPVGAGVYVLRLSTAGGGAVTRRVAVIR